jgi:hypothetical protein
MKKQLLGLVAASVLLRCWKWAATSFMNENWVAQKKSWNAMTDQNVRAQHQGARI